MDSDQIIPPGGGGNGNRKTYIKISYWPEWDADFPWFVSRRVDGVQRTADSFNTEDGVIDHLRHFLFQREGRILIERYPHPEFDRRAEGLDKTRQVEDDGPGTLIQTFAPGSDVHGW